MNPDPREGTLRSAILNRRVFICVITGIVSGMPLYILIQMIPAWLRDDGVSLVDIGLLSLVQIPYAWKFMWAPLLDRWAPPFLGRRRGWILVFQVGLLVIVGTMGAIDPSGPKYLVAGFALAIALFSASQDIVIDAYRRELLPEEELGIGNAVHVQAYRISSLVPGSLSLILADFMAWSVVFWITAAFMLVGILLSLWVQEPETEVRESNGLWDILSSPFIEYLNRRKWSGLLMILSFMVLYKLGDNMATALATPFYQDMGFSLAEIGTVAKHAALWPAIIGGLLGGVVMIRLGINRALWIFGVVQMLSILGFAVLASHGHNLWLLAAVISFEYLGVGLGTAAFTAFIARETSRTFAAAQFALFTALASLPRTVASASTGFLVESLGWVDFFLLCTCLAIPGMLLLAKVAPWSTSEAQISAP